MDESGRDIAVPKRRASLRQPITFTPTNVQRIAQSRLSEAIDGIPVGSVCQELERVGIQRGREDRRNASHLSKQCDALERGAASVDGGALDRLKRPRVD